MPIPDPVRFAAARAMSDATGTPRVLVGFDGFLDSITSAVDTRQSMRADDYMAMNKIDTLASRIADASGGRSINIELREREVRAGGNGPLLASSLTELGIGVTLIGALGADSAEPIHPGYQALAARCDQAYSIAPSARTDALEFDDGKVMFNWSANLDSINWDTVCDAIGLDRLVEMCAEVNAIATMNWTNVGGLPSIWRGLRNHVLPRLESKPSIFVDLSDPTKRIDADILDMIEELRALNDVTPLTLGLNFAEAQRISKVTIGAQAPLGRGAEEMADAANRLRESIGLATVLVHTRGMVAGAEDGMSAAVRTRINEHPILSTGAGDHFSGGYLAARLLGLDLKQSLACGCDTASSYVGIGQTPTRSELVQVLESADQLPD